MNFLNMKPMYVIFFACHLTGIRMQISKMTEIKSGSPVASGELPWQALIINYIRPGVLGTCGGSLISKEWVLTAAHCILESARYIEVKLGALTYYDSKEKGQVIFRIKSYYKYPLFNNIDLRYDICLIKLPQPVQFSDKIKAVALPRIADLNVPLRRRRGLICGWGLNSDGIPVLHHARVMVVPKKICKKSNIVFALFNHKIMFCAAGRKFDAVCMGDTGGPLIMNNTVVAVVSSSFDCALGTPSAYTRTVVFLRWITETTGIAIS